MGKRGPAPKGEYGHRTAVFSTRLQSDTRSRLVAAAKKSNRSLSQELEHRLRRTFIDEDKAVDFYGTEQNAAVVKLIGTTIQSAAARTSPRQGRLGIGLSDDSFVVSLHDGRKLDWLTEQWLFDDVMDAIAHMLLWFRPGGDSGRGGITLSSGTDRADQLIEEIRSSDPSLPITKGSTRQHAMATLKDGLGELVHRQHPYEEKFREAEPPVRIVVPRPAKKRRRK